MRYVRLLVMRSSILDSRDAGRAIIDEAFRADQKGNRHYRFTFNLIADKLNGYIRKYGGITAVDRASDADYLIVFNLLEYRRSLGYAYPYGEMFVIVNERSQPSALPRIVWKASKVLWAEDSVKEFIKALKTVRGQR